jgi:hypothetical protein
MRASFGLFGDCDSSLSLRGLKTLRSKLMYKKNAGWPMSFNNRCYRAKSFFDIFVKCIGHPVVMHNWFVKCQKALGTGMMMLHKVSLSNDVDIHL